MRERRLSPRSSRGARWLLWTGVGRRTGRSSSVRTGPSFLHDSARSDSCSRDACGRVVHPSVHPHSPGWRKGKTRPFIRSSASVPRRGRGKLIRSSVHPHPSRAAEGENSSVRPFVRIRPAPRKRKTRPFVRSSVRPHSSISRGSSSVRAQASADSARSGDASGRPRLVPRDPRRPR